MLFFSWIKKKEAPKDWCNYHHKNCGTTFRGCDPQKCPKDHYERTGEWRPKLADL